MKIAAVWFITMLTVCLSTKAADDASSRAKHKTPKSLSSISSDFNGTAIPAGGTIWFNSVLKVQGVGNQKVTIRFTNQVINIGGTTVALADSIVVFNPAVSSAQTTFLTNAWLTIVPTSNLAGNVFLGGIMYQVPAGLAGGVKPVTWTGNFSSDTSGVTVQWQWAAAAYKCPLCSCQAMPKPVDDNKASAYQNSDHAGTPEDNNIKACVTGGARGGGGSNWTGSYSGTGSITPICNTAHAAETKTVAPGSF